MSMKIKRISLYSNNGERRDVEFNLSGLSVITGRSKTGKSSILEIVDYCLGSSECGVAYGRIRETVSWYSITLQLQNSQVFIARKSPINGMRTSNEFSIIAGEDIELPQIDQIQVNARNKDVIIDYLTRIIGIPEQITEVPENNTRSPIKIDFHHSKYLYFQNQDEIANKKLIFHRQNEPHLPQFIKDTLPYFLGTAEDNRLAEIEKLRSLRRELANYKRKLSELKSIKGNGLQKGYQLLSEAFSVGLCQEYSTLMNDNELIASLRIILEWIPEDNKFNSDTAEKIAIVDKEYEELIQEKKLINIKVTEIKSYNQSISDYESAVSEQSLRLKSIGLFKKLDEHSTNPYIPIFKSSLEKLEKELGATERTKPKISEALLNLEDKQKELAQKITNSRALWRELKSQDEEITSKERLDLSRAKVIGRISLYLDGINLNYDTESIQRQIDILQPQIEELEEGLSLDAFKEKLEAQLNCIGEDMTKWARDLELEHSEYQIKLDINKLTVVADTPNGRIPLYQMGSGENYVGYHLVTYIALAKWFKTQHRPVANFIFFDQPTQVYFPAEIDKSGDISEIEIDEDRTSVHRMFEWLHNICETELKDAYQIIITDHADIDEEWFQDAICDKKWRGEYALIPNNW